MTSVHLPSVIKMQDKGGICITSQRLGQWNLVSVLSPQARVSVEKTVKCWKVKSSSDTRTSSNDVGFVGLFVSFEREHITSRGSCSSRSLDIFLSLCHITSFPLLYLLLKISNSESRCDCQWLCSIYMLSWRYLIFGSLKLSILFL
jgi:hypothetical protein